MQQVLIDNNIYPHGYRYSDGRAPSKPDNWDRFGQMLARSRPSLSPSRFGDAGFDDFVQADADAGKEQQVCESVLRSARKASESDAMQTATAAMITRVAVMHRLYNCCSLVVNGEHVERGSGSRKISLFKRQRTSWEQITQTEPKLNIQ